MEAAWLPQFLTGIRVLHVATTLLLGGAIIFRCAIAPLPLRPLLRWVLPLLLGGAALRLVLQSALLSGAGSPDEILAILPAVVTQTRFGQVLSLQTGFLLLASMLAWLRDGKGLVGIALAPALIGVVLPVAASHAAAMQNTSLMLALGAHLLAATAWLGGLLPLWRSLGDPSPDPAIRHRTVRRFSRLGLVSVLVLAGTAALQLQAMSGDVAGLLGTRYGWLLLGKAGLFLALLALAALNRFVLSPSLARREGVRALRGSILAETGLGFLVIVLAALLATTPPAIHEEPVWPFPWRVADWQWAAEWPSESRWSMVLVVLALLLSGLLVRRRRVILAVLAIALCMTSILVATDLRVTVVPAAPTSFQSVPQGYDAAGILRGLALFRRWAGSEGGLRKLLSEPLPQASDGELYWAVSRLPQLRTTEAENWDLAIFLRAAAAGQEVQRDGAWSAPRLAPDMPLLCGGTVTTLSALRGQVLRIADGFAPPVEGARTIHLGTGSRAADDCTASDPGARRVYALLSGVPEGRTQGLWLLVDGNGWLRGSGYRTIPDVMEEAVRSIAALPIERRHTHQ